MSLAAHGLPTAELTVSRVLGHDGEDLLRDEDCGPQRNGIGAALNSTTKHLRVNDAFVQVPAVSGSKTVRLRPGVGIGQVASLEGHIRLRLPSGIEVVRLSAPFVDQTIDAPGVRVKFADAGAGSIKYEISGATDRVLAVRALNESEQYLRRGGSFASGRLLGRSRTVVVRSRQSRRPVQVRVATLRNNPS